MKKRKVTKLIRVKMSHIWKWETDEVNEKEKEKKRKKQLSREYIIIVYDYDNGVMQCKERKLKNVNAERECLCCLVRLRVFYSMLCCDLLSSIEKDKTFLTRELTFLSKSNSYFDSLFFLVASQIVLVLSFS